MLLVTIWLENFLFDIILFINLAFAGLQGPVSNRFSDLTKTKQQFFAYYDIIELYYKHFVVWLKKPQNQNNSVTQQNIIKIKFTNVKSIYLRVENTLN